MKRYIHFPQVEGQASRQAHADLPRGHLRARDQQGRLLRPGRASSTTATRRPAGSTSRARCARTPSTCTKLDAVAGLALGARRSCCTTPRCASASGARRGKHGRARPQRRRRRAAVRPRRAAASSTATTAISSFEAGDYLVLPRGTMWRLECAEPLRALLIEATNASLPAARQGPGRRRTPSSTRPCSTRRASTTPSARSRTRQPWRVAVKRRDAVSTVTYPVQPARCGRLARRPVAWRASTCATSAPLMSHRYHLPPSAHTTFVGDRFVVCTFVPRPFETDPGRDEGAVLPQQRRLRRGHLLPRGRLLQPRQHPSRA